MALDTAQLRQRANVALAGFTHGQKAVVGIAVISLLLGGLLFTRWVSKPSYATLYSNLEASDASEITGKLASKNIPYELSDNGKSILVPHKDVYQLRLDMSAEGLPSSGGGGYELLDKGGITQSEFRQKIDYQRAMEGELSKTISSIDGVQGATVKLVIPKDDVFAEDTRQASAAVLVKTKPGKTLDAGQVQAVVNLVSSSVEGLEPGKVTVADSKGRVLSAPGQDGMMGAATDTRTAHTTAFQDQFAARVQTMLERTIGADKAVVVVNAELDFDERETLTERYGSAGAAPQPSSQETITETFTGDGNPTGGILGPDAAPITGGTSDSNYEKSEQRTDLLNDKTVEQVKTAPGQPKQVRVTVWLDKNAKGANAEDVQESISALLDEDRGDAVVVKTMAFDQTGVKAAEEELKAAQKAKLIDTGMSVAKSVGTALIVGIVLLLFWKSAKKRGLGAATATPIDLRQVQAARATAALPAGGAAALDDEAIPELSMDPKVKERMRVDAQIGDLIERQPDEVAQLLRSWLADRRS